MTTNPSAKTPRIFFSGAAILSFFIFACASPAQTPTATPTDQATVAVVTLAGSIVERRNPLEILFPTGYTLRDLTTSVTRAAEDPDVAALMVRIENPQWSMAQAMSFRSALDEYKESGKPLYVSADMLSTSSYVVASAGEIMLPPVGAVDLTGMNFSIYYIADLLGKLGIEAQAVNTGKFKDALDPFLHNQMQEGTRIQMTALLEDYFGAMVDAVATGRDISEEKAREILTGGPYGSTAALTAGAIDRIAYLENLESEIGDDLEREVTFDWEYVDAALPKMEPPNFMSILMGSFGSSARRTEPDHIAVVYALGPIVDGRRQSSNPFAQEEVIASDDFVDMLDEIGREENLRAIVLRVNSPGGSAIASDRIWNRLETFQADGIPVVVSMGGVAASGGYYISMGADHIVAEPTTITGSIGVIGGKFNLAGTYDKIGISKESLSIGENVGIYSETDFWDEREQAILNELLEYIYEEFTSKAAAGRDMTQEEIKELGGGRVWSGVAALENGLVDELGGLEDAITVARDLADAGDARVIEYPRELTFMELMEKLMTGDIAITSRQHAIQQTALYQAAATTLPPEVLNTLLHAVVSMQDRPSAQVLLPLNFTIE